MVNSILTRMPPGRASKQQHASMRTYAHSGRWQASQQTCPRKRQVLAHGGNAHCQDADLKIHTKPACVTLHGKQDQRPERYLTSAARAGLMETFMLARWNRVWMASVILVPLASPAALAQIKGAWVDPPPDQSAPQALDQPLDVEAGPLDLKVDPSPNVVAGRSPSAPLSVPRLAERPGDEPGPSGKAVEAKQESRSTDFTSLEPTILGSTVRSRIIPPQTAARGQAV